MANPTPGIFSLKIFKSDSIVPNILVKIKDTGNVERDVAIGHSNELNSLEYRKFMDDEGLTKKINEYKKVMLLLGGKVKADGVNGYVKDDGSDEGFPKQSAELYISANKVILDEGPNYIKRISDLTSDGLTLDEARKIAANESKGKLNSELKILDEEKPLSLFMQHAKANFETKMKMHKKKKETNPFL